MKTTKGSAYNYKMPTTQVIHNMENHNHNLNILHMGTSFLTVVRNQSMN